VVTVKLRNVTHSHSNAVSVNAYCNRFISRIMAELYPPVCFQLVLLKYGFRRNLNFFVKVYFCTSS